MLDRGKHNIIGVQVHAVDYEHAVASIVAAAKEGRPWSTSALAVHGVMTGNMDSAHRRRLNGLDLIVPDGQPVRWALRLLHGIRLPDRVYGPELTIRTIAACGEAGLPIYLYGSRPEVLEQLSANLIKRFPSLVIAGAEPSKFRTLTEPERTETAARIRASGARVVMCGLGCPRQEVWAFEYRDLLRMPILAVGAAFDFHAGTLPQAPPWMQRRGLEWVFRLWQEPRRLWRRYLLLNPAYTFKIACQWLRLRKFAAIVPDGTEPTISYG